MWKFIDFLTQLNYIISQVSIRQSDVGPHMAYSF